MKEVDWNSVQDGQRVVLYNMSDPGWLNTHKLEKGMTARVRGIREDGRFIAKSVRWDHIPEEGYHPMPAMGRFRIYEEPLDLKKPVRTRSGGDVSHLERLGDDLLRATVQTKQGALSLTYDCSGRFYDGHDCPIDLVNP